MTIVRASARCKSLMTEINLIHVTERSLPFFNDFISDHAKLPVYVCIYMYSLIIMTIIIHNFT